LSELQRGDLMFWKGHVEIARDATTLLHANAFHMAVAVELLWTPSRIRSSDSEIVSVRRTTALLQ
jgi:hypothetical protein